MPTRRERTAPVKISVRARGGVRGPLGFRIEMSYALIDHPGIFMLGHSRRLWMLACQSRRAPRALGGVGVAVGVLCFAGAALAQTPPAPEGVAPESAPPEPPPAES